MDAERLVPFAQKKQGFTLVELLVGITIMAILTFVAIPGITNLYQNAKAENVAQAWASTLRVAKNTAITESARVVICALNVTEDGCSGNNAFGEGWMIFVDPDNNSQPDTDANLRLLRSALPDFLTLDLSGNRSELVFLPAGFPDGSAQNATMIVEASSCYNNKRFRITLEASGLATVTREACS